MVSSTMFRIVACEDSGCLNAKNSSRVSCSGLSLAASDQAALSLMMASVMCHNGNDASTSEEPPPAPSTPATSPIPAAAATEEAPQVLARRVTVEPVLFVHNLCSQVMWLASQDLQIDKACAVNVGLSDDICANLGDHDALESTVQDLVTSMLMYRSIFEASIKAVWLLMLGAWSDRYSRQLPLIISICGLGGEALVYLIISFLPSWPVETVLVASVPYSLSGGTHALLMICFAYLADASKPGERTVRMGLLDAAYYFGSPVGMAVAGPLLDAAGYRAAFILTIALYVVTVVYVVVRFSNERKKSTNTEEPEMSKCKQCQTSCDVTHLYKAVQVTVQPRPHHITCFILLLILAMLCDSLPVWGESNVKYLFTQKVMDWTHTQYSHWGTFASLLSVCVMVIVVPFLSLVVHLPDAWVGVLGGASRTASSIIYGCVTSPDLSWLMWMGAVVGSAKNMAPVAIRSLLSQLSGSNEIGRIFAVMAMAETLVVLAAAPLYKTVYSATIDSRAGTYNFLSAGFNIILTLILLFLAIQLKKVWRLLREKSERPTQCDTNSSSVSEITGA
ncbi:proton-coupled folate transporter-like isoform X2 [Eriocheir sinensis]|uniref:proton-coupled folate transporter-like isoform X2 n=1 Tax=Eriocheir sinensis TaxID=95602 RepID=UPI0021C84524|nr:proton-coupled folate transporter-like isoform X2 [Eriocheir sinensis]